MTRTRRAPGNVPILPGTRARRFPVGRSVTLLQSRARVGSPNDGVGDGLQSLPAPATSRARGGFYGDNAAGGSADSRSAERLLVSLALPARAHAPPDGRPRRRPRPASLTRRPRRARRVRRLDDGARPRTSFGFLSPYRAKTPTPRFPR